MNDPSIPLVLAAVLIVGFVAGPVLLLAADPSSSLHADNAPAEGRAAIGSLASLDPADQTLVVRAPGESFSREDVAHLVRFLHEGGRILVVDDSTIGRSLLERMAVGITLSPHDVITPAFLVEPGRVLVVSPLDGFQVPPSAILTRPHTVMGGTPLLRILGPAWEDADADGRPEPGDPPASGVVAAQGTFGEGALLVVGDADALDATSALRAPLLAWAHEGERSVVYDETHRASADPFGLVRTLGGQAPLVVKIAIAFFSLAIVAFALLRPRRGNKPSGSTRGAPPVRDDLDAHHAILELDTP